MDHPPNLTTLYNMQGDGHLLHRVSFYIYMYIYPFISFYIYIYMYLNPEVGYTLCSFGNYYYLG